MELIEAGIEVEKSGIEPILLTIFTLFKVFLICKVFPTARGDEDTEVEADDDCWERWICVSKDETEACDGWTNPGIKLVRCKCVS